MTTERVWLCWSFSQSCPHIESEADGLRTNLRAFVLNRPVDYVPIGVFESRDDASRFMRTLREQIETRFESARQRRLAE